MDSDKNQPIDWERMLAAMAPPRVPDSAFDKENLDLFKVASWKKTFAISVLAGLLTEPQYYANGIRLDWLQRLVFSKANGRRKPSCDEISRALNAGLERAKVLRLEDPSEDLFCDLIITQHGNFRIFTGQWEKAGPFTQTLLDAFEALPNSSQKRDVLASVYALLRLSDELAERSSVVSLAETGGTPQGTISLPNAETLRRLVHRVRFSDAEIARLGIDKAALVPFIIEPGLFPYVSDRLPGDTPLEFFPLLGTANGIVVASPAGISLAIRAALVGAAKDGGMDKPLLYLLLKTQQKYSETSGFWPTQTLELPPPDKHFLRVAACQFADGHFLQVIQIPVTFDKFPQCAFGSVVELDAEAGKAIADYIHKFWNFLAGQPDCRSGITVLLTSGWGTPHNLTLPKGREQKPRSWRFLPISFADAAVLGACEDGKLADIARIDRQMDFLEAEGFEFQNLNGVLNLFGFWRLTGGNLIPEHFRQIEPPCRLSMPTDGLLKPRVEAFKKIDKRALPIPGAGFKTVQRIGWDDDELKPTYGSIEDVRRGRLLGAVVFNKHVWWIESIPEPSESRERRYRIWHAVLEWLAAVGPQIVLAFPKAYPPQVVSQAELVIPPDSAFDEMGQGAHEGRALSDTVTVSALNENGVSHITISKEWLAFLRLPENSAEIELIAATLEAFADPTHPVSRAEIAKQVRNSIGSSDWRWLHARRAVTPMDRLNGHDLVDHFRRIPVSAMSLAKCGSVWGFWKRSDGLEINGEEECKNFLTRYRDHVLDELIVQVRQFNRQKLVALAAKNYQAARVEQQQWRGTIRALRAIHGEAADANAFRRQNEINAVQRAAKIVCEIAACEAPDSDGLNPGQLELEELFAKALLLFGNGQLFAVIRAGLIKPVLKISPAGALLSDRSVFEKTLKPGVEWTHARAFDEAARAYGRDPLENPSAPKTDKLPLEDGLRRALETEYADSAEAFVDLQFALIQLSEGRREGVFAIKRSELCRLLGEIQAFPSGDHAALLQRLTLQRRRSWRDRSSGLTESDIDLSRFDRRFSLINQPLLALDDADDPLVLVAPILVADATMYSLSGLMDGALNNQYWRSMEARKYAGLRGKAVGEAFEESVANRLRDLKLETWVRCKLSRVLNQKVDEQLGDVDILAVSPDRKRVWVIETKNLRLCRTEAEVAARLSEYRGRMTRGSQGREEPDKMLRHIRRVQYLRERRDALCHRMKLAEPPIVKGLLIVDAPQPMNFHMLDKLEDGESAFLDAIDRFDF